jgi:hypothetical protein
MIDFRDGSTVMDCAIPEIEKLAFGEALIVGLHRNATRRFASASGDVQQAVQSTLVKHVLHSRDISQT